jgi:predicted DNA-binding antitoxin AbrB/MazE fold protein
MKVTEFARKVTLEEGKKVSLSIAQIMEVLKITNRLLGGGLYKLIREHKRKKK